jgi:hypothetical protein
MTKDEIIDMAREAGFSNPELVNVFERFAALVASAEREACAKLCDDLDDDLPDGLAGWQYGEAIRARGQE